MAEENRGVSPFRRFQQVRAGGDTFGGHRGRQHDHSLSVTDLIGADLRAVLLEADALDMFVRLEDGKPQIRIPRCAIR